MIARAWPTVWCEVLSLLLTSDQAPMAATVATLLMSAGVKSDVFYTFLDRADRATKRKEKRAKELTMEYALEQ